MTDASDSTLLLDLAGVRFHLHPDPAAPGLRLPPEYQSFLIPRAVPIATDARYLVTPPGRNDVPVSPTWQNSLLRVGVGATHVFGMDAYDAVADRWYAVARLNSDLSSGRLAAHRHTDPAERLLCFHHPYDRALVAARLLYAGGGLIHGGSVAVAGRALLLIGPSGAGKTTLARLWAQAGARLLNDERTLIGLDRGGAWAGASPWPGEHRAIHPGRFPLAAIFHLSPAPRNACRPLGAAESAARLLAATFVPVFLRDGPDRLARLWSELTEHLPSFALAFTPDARALDLCRQAAQL